MRNTYEALVELIETLEVCNETDTLLQNLGEEMLADCSCGAAFREAVAYLVRAPATDPSDAARFVRLCRLCLIEPGMPAAEPLAAITFSVRCVREAVAA